jgi:glycosyltransferase involved in cell wall biosynthesis
VNITYVCYFFPPEVSAAAAGVYDNAVRLVRMGHRVTVLTGLPNNPRGALFPGYRFRPLTVEMMDGIQVVRVASWFQPNTSAIRRLTSYGSLMVAQILAARTVERPDVVVGSSPPLFQALAGLAVARLNGCPFVMEVRDLWPENMVAIGALRNGPGLRMLAALERLLYRQAARIVAVTHGFKDYIVARGVPDERVSVVTNGVDLALYRMVPYPGTLARELHLIGKFVAGYIGTVGINHGLQTILDAAERLRDDPDIVLLIVGDGAERPALERQASERGITNIRFLGERTRDEMPEYHSLCDAMLVLLKDSPYFHKVIPSKVFVGMAMAKPIILGVDGEARRIVEEAEAGVFVPPENVDAVVDAIRRLKALKSSDGLAAMGVSGREHVRRHFDRDQLARLFERALVTVAQPDSVRSTV